MSVELRLCRQGWVFCDGNCEKCITITTSTTTTNPFDYSQVCWSSAKCEYKTKDGNCKLNHCIGKDGGEMTELEKEFSTKGFANEMRRIDRNNCTEMAHILADELMCKLLRELGYSEGVDIFEKMDKWYS